MHDLRLYNEIHGDEIRFNGKPCMNAHPDRRTRGVIALRAVTNAVLHVHQRRGEWRCPILHVRLRPVTTEHAQNVVLAKSSQSIVISSWTKKSSYEYTIDRESMYFYIMTIDIVFVSNA